MDEGEKILWTVVNKIASGSADDEPSFRAAPREVLVELARKAVDEYRNLTSHSSGQAKSCVFWRHCKFVNTQECGTHCTTFSPAP